MWCLKEELLRKNIGEKIFMKKYYNKKKGLAIYRDMVDYRRIQLRIIELQKEKIIDED